MPVSSAFNYVQLNTLALIADGRMGRPGYRGACAGHGGSANGASWTGDWRNRSSTLAEPGAVLLLANGRQIAFACYARLMPLSLIGVLLVALAVCPAACAAAVGASNAPTVTRAAIQDAESPGEASAASPEQNVGAVPGGAVYNPFAGASRSEEKASAIVIQSATASDPDMTATVLAVLGSVAAFGYLLLRAVNG